MTGRASPQNLAASLPRRTAHALYALALYARMTHSSGPFYAEEITVHDPEALNTRATGTALSHARRMGLCQRVRAGQTSLWWATSRGNSLWPHLETRVLKDQEGQL